MKYFSVTEMMWPKNVVYSRFKKTCLIGSDLRKCHIIIILIVFFLGTENENFDGKMTIPTNRDANHNLSQNYLNMTL